MSSIVSVIDASLDCVKIMMTPDRGISITAAVGAADPPRCLNRHDDVVTIQKALNNFSPLEGGPVEPLKIDGIWGPKTRKAISHFQDKWMIWMKGTKIPDGIVDVNGATIKRLRAGSGKITNPVGEFAGRITEALQIITTARGSLLAARAELMSPSAMFGKFNLERVERHFHINQINNPGERINQIDTVFLNMQMALGYVPMGIILVQEEPPAILGKAYMFAYPTGYWRREKGDVSPEDKLHYNSIYICPPARLLNAEAFVYVMIHELAHYVSPLGTLIQDQAYYAKNPEKYKRLSAEQAYVNADSYSQFAYDAINKRYFNTKNNMTG